MWVLALIFTVVYLLCKIVDSCCLHNKDDE